ncbi:hypothetical protein BD309DRAFT_695974 [Dichomitus squalens]|nr:hypothetical protein BD309DRAFT_695974 [Dichomitus squalens]
MELSGTLERVYSRRILPLTHTGELRKMRTQTILMKAEMRIYRASPKHPRMSPLSTPYDMTSRPPDSCSISISNRTATPWLATRGLLGNAISGVPSGPAGLLPERSWLLRRITMTQLYCECIHASARLTTLSGEGSAQESMRGAWPLMI